MLRNKSLAYKLLCRWILVDQIWRLSNTHHRCPKRLHRQRLCRTVWDLSRQVLKR